MTDENRWYFAYGSNMLEEVFVKRRKIEPLRSEVAAIKTHTLCFNIMGVPYTEPAMGGIRPIEGGEVPVYGVAYLLTAADMSRVVLTEGGGIAYKLEVLDATLEVDGSVAKVVTLVGRHGISRSWERVPSKRYMGLLIRGAHEKSLPQQYQERLLAQPTFEPTPTSRFELGRRTFNMVWMRAQYWIEKAVHRLKDAEGNVPKWFLGVFDCLLYTMWFQHDYVHSNIFGRGDGLLK
ncbi:Gamma-glutamyl cyclotransferase gliK [Paramyrothecium foliicola]|nr:Gamma-glutamyl cyclotransferase gliK [Paramyrothecium foliicola]